MELDFKYQQYNNQQGMEKTEFSNTQIKPNQELIDYFEANSKNFNYTEFLQALKIQSSNQYSEIYLSDGTFVKIGIASGVVNVGILYPNKTKFIGCWSNIADNKEMLSQMDKVPKSS